MIVDGYLFNVSALETSDDTDDRAARLRDHIAARAELLTEALPHARSSG